MGARLKRPWDGLGPNDPPDGGFTLRMNAFQRACAKYLAGVHGKSMTELLLELVTREALADLERREGR